VQWIDERILDSWGPEWLPAVRYNILICFLFSKYLECREDIPRLGESSLGRSLVAQECEAAKRQNATIRNYAYYGPEDESEPLAS
jgi:hypothetical protein